MEKLFSNLRAFIDAQEKALAEMSAEDAVFALGDMAQELGDMISQFAQVAGDQLLEGGDLGEVEIPEPEFSPDIARLAQAAVLTLAIRGDIYEQLKDGGFVEEAAAVAAFLDASVTARASRKTKR